jgi:hypothetical protein
MYRSSFIPIKRLAGQLILSQRHNHWGATLTTKELIFQRPHLSYHIFLDDILGLVPYPLPTNQRGTHSVVGWLEPNRHRDFYKLSVARLHLVNRQGAFTQDTADLIIPLNSRFIHFLSQVTNLTLLP